MSESDEVEENKALVSTKDNWSKYIGLAKGYLAVFLYLVCVVASASSVQLLENRIPDFELNSFRCATPFIFSALAIIVTRNWPIIERSEISSTILYSVLCLLAAITMYAAATFLPLASVQCIVQTVNITSGMCLFYLLLDDKMDIYVLMSALMCIGGVILVIQPSFMFNNEKSSHKATDKFEISAENNDTLGSRNLILSADGHLPIQMLKYLLPTATGLVLTFDIVLLKKRPYLSEHITEVLFWCFLQNTILSLVLMLLLETPVLPNNWYDIILIAFHCVSYLAMWPLYMFAIKYISGNTFNIISSSMVVLMLVTQYTVLSSVLPGHRNWVEILGVALVLLGSALCSLLELYGTLRY